MLGLSEDDNCYILCVYTGCLGVIQIFHKSERIQTLKVNCIDIHYMSIQVRP